MFWGSDSSYILVSFNCYHRPSTTLKNNSSSHRRNCNWLICWGDIWFERVSSLSINIVVTRLVVSVDPTCSIQVSQPSEGLFMWARSTGLARFLRSRHSFLRKSLYVFIREAGLAWLSKSRKPSHCGWPGSYEEAPKQLEVEKLTSPTYCTVPGEGRTNYLIITYPLFSLVPISRALYIPTDERLPGQPRAKKLT